MNMRYAWGVIYNEETSKKNIYIYSQKEESKEREKKKKNLHLPFKILKKRKIKKKLTIAFILRTFGKTEICLIINKEIIIECIHYTQTWQ